MIDLQLQGEHTPHPDVFNARLTPAPIGLGSNRAEAGLL
jgi:hypothetical protein